MSQASPSIISAEFPFVKREVNVLGSKMAYVDVGHAGTTTAVFLHGNPTSSYLWRNVIPAVARKMRCVAPDLIGFGGSDKVPSSSYRIVDHQRYVDAFLDAVLPTQKIVLVVHDWGSALGFDWARRHEERIAGMAFMEWIPPSDSWNDYSDAFQHMFKRFREPEVGRKLIIDGNAFVEQVLPSGVVRKLGDAEMEHYRKPFLEKEAREPTYRFPNEIPIEGKPADVWDIAQKYTTWLLESAVPKLMFWAPEGAFVPEWRAKLFLEKMRNVQDVRLPGGKHFVQEDHPDIIGREIAAWLPVSSENL